MLIGTIIAAIVAPAATGCGLCQSAHAHRSGALAISVMLLPGVSGSLALLVIGMYHPISQAVSTVDIVTIFWVGLGVIIGISLFIPLLNRLLQRAHDNTMAVLAGLMLGSLVALWPWKAHYAPKQITEWGAMTPQLPHGTWWWAMALMIAGIADSFH